MKIVIDIPKEFETHFEIDRFAESLERIEDDVKNRGALSGRYDRETITMLRKALVDGTPLPKGHGRLIDVDALRESLNKHRYSDDFCIEHNIDRSINIGMVGIAIGDAPTIIEADKEGAEE